MLRGDPETVKQIRRQVIADLEEVREEIEELLEIKVRKSCVRGETDRVRDRDIEGKRRSHGASL